MYEALPPRTQPLLGVPVRTPGRHDFLLSTMARYKPNLLNAGLSAERNVRRKVDVHTY